MIRYARWRRWRSSSERTYAGACARMPLYAFDEAYSATPPPPGDAALMRYAPYACAARLLDAGAAMRLRRYRCFAIFCHVTRHFHIYGYFA